MKFQTVQQVAAWRLCIGCGACAYACPEGSVSFADVEKDGIRPRIKAKVCKTCGECVKVCPGVAAAQQTTRGEIAELSDSWGSILEMWEGYAAAQDVRYSGSSGGLATALAAYCVEKQGMSGVLHTGPDADEPLKNKTHFSQNRADLLSRTGSRYAPASPCDGLTQIEDAARPSVFVGKGCDVEALCKAQALRSELNAKVGLAIGIFCAGTPSTRATLDLLKKSGVEAEKVAEIRYRGRGWPGNFSVRLNGDDAPRVAMPYMEAWEFLQKYRPYRCYLCPDATAELADVSCGDPWYRAKKEDEQGFSLVLVRTERGRAIVQGAVEAGYVILERRDPQVLVESQRGMLAKRGAIWGRMLAMKMFGIPTPRYDGFHLYENWKHLPASEKARAVLGTMRRIVKRKYYRPQS